MNFRPNSKQGVASYPYLSSGRARHQHEHNIASFPPCRPSNAATHGAAAALLHLRVRVRRAPALPPLPARRAAAAPPLRPRPRGLRRLRGVLLRRLGDVRGRRRRRGGGRRRVRVRPGAGARRRRPRYVGRGGRAGAGGARDAAVPARPPPVRDHGRAPPRHVRGGAPRLHPALRGAARRRRRHVRGGLQPGGHPAGIQHQEEEQPDRAAVHLLRRHLPPHHLLHQARVHGRPAAEAQRRRRRHPLHQLQGPPAEGRLAFRP